MSTDISAALDAAEQHATAESKRITMDEELTLNLRIDPSPECLKRLCDGMAAAVKPDGGYRAATLEDPAIGDGGDQMVRVEWWIPQHGCDSLENTLDAIKGRLLVAVRDWWETALAPAVPLAQGEVGKVERLRIMVAGIRYGYMAGHDDTVEGRYADPDELAADDAPVVLGELGATFESMLEQQAQPTPAAPEVVSQPYKLPEPGEAGKLAAELRHFVAEYKKMRGLDPEGIYSIQEGVEGREAHLRVSQLTRIAALLQQPPAPAPAAVPVAVSERLPGEGDCDEEGRCWLTTTSTSPGWVLDCPERCTGWTHWVPAGAIPAMASVGRLEVVLVPVALAERLPGKEDCAPWPDEPEAIPWCWAGKYIDGWEWMQLSMLGIRKGHPTPWFSDGGWTHWLPHHAIPLPQAGEGE